MSADLVITEPPKSEMATWRQLFDEDFGINPDDWPSTFNPGDVDKEFDDGLGVDNGERFTLWTDEHVYFPVHAHGCEEIGRVPRNPCGVATYHIGGLAYEDERYEREKHRD